MSRSGYTDEIEDAFVHGRWRQAVKRSLEGKRGQQCLRELVAALDAMDDKRLYPGSFATADGEFCALGVLGARRGTKMDDLGGDSDCDPATVGQRFGISMAMAAEIMYLNDEYLADSWKWVDVVICGPMPGHHCPPYRAQSHQRTVHVSNDRHPSERWERMRAWAVENLHTKVAA
jgi:hypothetical protein